MSDEKNDVSEETTNSQEEKESLTKDKVEELVKGAVNEVNKNWQSKFDKLLSEKKEAEKELENTNKSWQEKLQDQVSGVQKELETWKSEAQNADLRGRAIKIVSREGLELDDVEEKLLYKLINPEAEEPMEDVEAYVAREKEKAEKQKLAAADELARKYGRKIQDSDEEGGLLTREQISEKSKDPEWFVKNKDLIFRSLKAEQNK